MSTLDNLAQQILADVLADFRNQKLGSEALADGYVGLSLKSIMEKYCGEGAASQVDFDLALKELETNKLIETGPTEPYKNDPNSAVFIMALFSKREYAYLTEAGYRAAQRVRPTTKPAGRMTVNISGGNFHQSPIGVGDQVTQSVNVNVENQPEVVDYLLQLLARSGVIVDDGARQEIKQLVDVTSKGDVTTAKPIFQRLFGAATESVKQIAWGVVSAMIAKQLGL